MALPLHETPAAPKQRFPLYGWVVVGIAALAMVATLPGRTHGLGMITERLLADPRLQLDRVAYGDLNLWATLLGGLFCLPCGWLIDRVGLRVSLTVCLAALAATVFWMTLLSGYWPFFAAIVFTRGFGQSALSVISITMVAKWSGRGSTLVMAIYTLILSLGFAFAAQFAKPYAADDWRVLWSGIGWVLVGFLPLALLLTREPPLARAAAAAEGEAAANSAAAGLPSMTLWEAMRTPAFWVFGLSISLIALIGSGQSLFNESVLAQQGFPNTVYYNLITLSGMAGLAAMLPVGWIGQWCPLNRMLAAGLFLLTACLLWLPQIHTMNEVTVYGVGMGISGTITTVLFFTIWGRAYGPAHLGQIQAVAQMLTVLASAAGPKVFAECFARWGTYTPVFQTMAGVVAVVAVAACLVRVPDPARDRRRAPARHLQPAFQEFGT